MYSLGGTIKLSKAVPYPYITQKGLRLAYDPAPSGIRPLTVHHAVRCFSWVFRVPFF